MWQAEPTTQFEKDAKRYEKKHSRELAAVLNNVDRLLQYLNAGMKPGGFSAGFIHPEPGGVWAVDQKGGGGNLQETRLYTFPDANTLTLWLITIGNKPSQSSDVQLARGFVESLRQIQP